MFSYYFLIKRRFAILEFKDRADETIDRLSIEQYARDPWHDGVQGPPICVRDDGPPGSHDLDRHNSEVLYPWEDQRRGSDALGATHRLGIEAAGKLDMAWPAMALSRRSVAAACYDQSPPRAARKLELQGLSACSDEPRRRTDRSPLALL